MREASLEIGGAGAAAAPEVTVAMPARNADRFIGAAIESILRQKDVALELIIVDDDSDDDTAAVAESYGNRDARVRVLRNRRRRGIGACHNRILRLSRAPYVAHVDADDFILPDAIRKLIDALKRNPEAGQSHCYFFDVDARGHLARRAFADRWRHFRKTRPPDLDYRKALVTSSVGNALRTFPRRTLVELGGFDESLPYGVDYHMALRVMDRSRIVLVPEFLYGRRVHDTNTTESVWLKPYRMTWNKYSIRRRLIAEGRLSYLTHPSFDLPRVTRERMAGWRARTRANVTRRAARCRALLRWRVRIPLVALFHRAARRQFADWPLVSAPGVAATETRIAYCPTFFPALSETFIRREVAALVEAGLPVEVIAQQPHGAEHFDAETRYWMERTSYAVARAPGARAGREFWSFFRRRPLATAGLYCYLAFRRHGAIESLEMTRSLWRRALWLAAALRERGITHVHSPWATADALIALIAARLVGARYTVQARASDLHKHVQQYGLAERLGHAEAIVTNAHYNEPVIRSKLREGTEKAIHVIYEGIDLARLPPPPERRRPPGHVPLILCVARLVEPKGIEVLIRACRILKDQGRTVRCEILGGRNPAETNYYIALMKVRRTLDLEHDVLFSGACSFEGVLEKYAAADVYALAAVQSADGRRDVTPNTLIEAMAMKLPIVSTRSGAIPELIEDGVSGLLVESRNAEALAAAIARLLDDASLRTALGEAARRRAEERFDIARNARSYARIFAPAGAADVAAFAPGSSPAEERA